MFLQLLVPDKPRYLQAELLSVVHPLADHASQPATASEPADNAAAAGTDAEAVDADVRRPFAPARWSPVQQSSRSILTRLSFRLDLSKVQQPNRT